MFKRKSFQWAHINIAYQYQGRARGQSIYSQVRFAVKLLARFVGLLRVFGGGLRRVRGRLNGD